MALLTKRNKIGARKYENKKTYVNLDKKAALSIVGAFLGTDLPSVPTAVANSLCAKPISGT